MEPVGPLIQQISLLGLSINHIYLFMSKALRSLQFSCEEATFPETPSSSGLCLILSLQRLSLTKLFENGLGQRSAVCGDACAWD